MTGQRIVRRAALVVASGVVAALIPVSAATVAAQTGPNPKPVDNVSERLRTLASQATVARSDVAENRVAGLPADDAGSLLHQPDGTFLANARLTSVDPVTEAALEAAGARVTARSVTDHLVTLALDATAIDAVGAVDGVEWLEEVLTPTINRAGRSEVASALAEGGVTTSASCGARVVSEADSHLGVAAARSTYGVDGTGI